MFYLLILLTGCVAGFLAGLLGVGGGLIIVPALAFLLALQGHEPTTIMHIALGTSLASIVFTSISSVYAHHRHGAVRWLVVWRMGCGLVPGALLGAGLAGVLPSQWLSKVFGVFVLLVAVQMFFGLKAGHHRDLPGLTGQAGAGGVIGVISALVGIGGGTLSVPYLNWHGVGIRQAVATAAANGLPIALAGAAGYTVTGLLQRGWQGLEMGYVHLGALAVVVAGTVTLAPLGAYVAHRIEPARLKRVFAILLLIIAIRMLVLR